MKLLLDTHAFISACADPAKLTSECRAALVDPDNDVAVSAATAWEIAIKQALGRLSFPVGRFDELLTAIGFQPLPITPAHAIAAGALPRHHADPFDRMLVAQARNDGLTLVTSDRRIADYQVATMDAGKP